MEKISKSIRYLLEEQALTVYNIHTDLAFDIRPISDALSEHMTLTSFTVCNVKHPLIQHFMEMLDDETRNI